MKHAGDRAPGYNLRMAILMHFRDPADSPTGGSPVRLRYHIVPGDGGPTTIALMYSHGQHQLTREGWQGYAMAGATLTCSSDRERGVVREVLGVDVV